VSYTLVFILDLLFLYTVLILMSIFLSAKPRPSKKARLNKPADDNVAVEPEKTPDPEETDANTMLNDPPPQDQDLFTEQVEILPQAMLKIRPARPDLMINRPAQLRTLTIRQLP
jgi:hypothetical protein